MNDLPSEAAPEAPLEAAPEASRPAKHRSPNHPAFSLEGALQKANLLYAEARTTAIPAPVACQIMGVKVTSSSGMRWLSTLQKFGLATREGRGEEKNLRITELGRVLLRHHDRSSAEYRQALQDAALAPSMHRRVWELREEGHLPPDQSLQFTLTAPNWGFSEVAAQAFVAQFRETIAFAGLTAEGDQEETEGEGEDDPPPSPPGGNAASPAGATPPQTEHAWMPPTTDTSKIIPLPLQSGGTATLHLPYLLDGQDYDWMRSLLDGLKRSMLAVERPAKEPADLEEEEQEQS